MRLAADTIATSLHAGMAMLKNAPDSGGDAARKNMSQLIQLRWIAVVGQVATIAIVQLGFHISLPLTRMSVVLAALVVLNAASLWRLKQPAGISNGTLFVALALDALALSAQLYLSGGADNPFTSLYLLQVIMGAVLLELWSAWVMVAITALSFCLLTIFYQPLDMSNHPAGEMLDLHIWGKLVGFVIDAALLVIFVTRISANLRARDARLADLRQQAAEEDHIVRMGLLASGAAHELGTPLATLDVILGDWRRMPSLAANPELAQEIEEMRAEVRRCKAIVTEVLLSAGEARSGTPMVTTLKTFLDDIVEDWRTSRSADGTVYQNNLAEDVPIVGDSTLKQVIQNVLDNALEASPHQVGVVAARRQDDLVLVVSDSGPGFTPETLANFGRPYNTGKGRPGGGLGLFLVVNVVRKLGGRTLAENRPGGGARVTLSLPLDALKIETEDAH
jgi:two-component system sensor histidine kinase RegB